MSRISIRDSYNLKKWQHIFYSMARAGGAIINLVILQWAMFYYSPPEGEGVTLIPIAWFGAVMFFGRLIDALADPFVGFWSDRSSTRWGRRIPFIAFGSLPLIVAFIMLWFPPFQAESTLNIVYFALMAGLYCFLYTMVFCPYNALLAEITLKPLERVAISTWTAFFSLLGAVFVALAVPAIIDSYGFKAMGMATGFAALFLLYGPVLSVKEKPCSEADRVSFRFFEAIRHTIRNKPFSLYLVAMAFFQLGGNAIIIAAPYYVTEVIGASVENVGLVMGAHLAMVFICFPFVNIMVARVGKKKLFSAALIATTAMLPLLYFVNRLEIPIPLLTQGMILFAISGIPMSVIYVLPNAIVTDTIDYDRTITGKNRAAMYFGIQGVVHKTAVGLSSVLVAFLFGRYGYQAEIAIPEGVYLVGPVAGLLALCGYLIFRKYPDYDVLGKNDF